MKSNKKRIGALLLCIIMALSLLLVSCQTEDETSDASKDSSQATSAAESNSNVNVPGWDAEANRWVLTLDPTKYEGKEFKVLVLGSTYGTYSSREFTFSEEDVLQSEVINEAAGKKNDYIKENYGVEIVPIYAQQADNILTLIRTDIQANSGSYDAVMPYMASLANLAQEGSLVDMAECDNIDFSMPWWDQSSIEQLSVHDKVFFATGDITLLNKVCATAIVFNKDIIQTLGLENPYDLVDEGTWTFDTMVTMAKKYVQDLDGNQIYDYNDNWGLSSSYGDVIEFYIAMGLHLAELDSNREPIITLGDTQSVTAIQKILTVLTDRSWVVHAQELSAMGATDIWDMSLRIFGEGRAMFRTSAFSAVEKLKANYEVNYGIVPLPKADENQENYYSYVATNGTVSGIAITTGAPDPDFSAYMIEVNAVEGKNYLTPAYYETVLKLQGTTDPESIEMLDLIFENAVYDLGRVFNFGDISGIISTLAQNSSTDIVSELDKNEDAINQAIQSLLDAYDALS
ncbi:MAG: hypothetical protein A2Y17_13085 [Clostridiales bacterium GWF2_38_85]|nr:MAG: hypothetical protein A2Y17_13085 [Clostridiales bacterium GWF2_38_85]